MMLPPNLSTEERRVLRLLRERPLPGYALVSLTEMDVEELAKLVESLQDKRLVEVKGGLDANSIEKAVVWIPPAALGSIRMLLGSEAS